MMGDDPGTICFTVDVEWAHPAVLQDIRDLFDGHGVRATFFCTHGGIDVGPHERGLHPNYRGNGSTLKELRANQPPEAQKRIDIVLQKLEEERKKEKGPTPAAPTGGAVQQQQGGILPQIEIQNAAVISRCL